MSLPSRSTDPSELHSAARRCMDQLSREEAILTTLAEAGKHIQHALQTSDLKSLAQAQQDSEQLAASLLPSVRSERAALRQQLAELLDCPMEQATVRLLTCHLKGPLADELTTARERTRILAESVDALNRRNAALAGYCLGFVQRCLAEITGSRRAGSRYGPTGTQVEASRGSLLEARG